jgi:hypothetical protein
MAQDNSQYGNFNSQTFTSNVDIDNFFRKFGFAGFAEWFNSNISKTSPWQKNEKGESKDYSINKTNWEIIWPNLPLIFGRNSINLVEFICMNSIMTNETGGSFKPISETVNSYIKKDGTINKSPGIVYEYGTNGGSKRSYNTLAGNYSAYTCFHDNDYIAAHGTKGLANILKNTTNTNWQTNIFPLGFSGLNLKDETSSNGKSNGFLIEADFFKFRGRGLIQTTSRPNYKGLIKFILSYTGNDNSILEIQKQWKAYGNNEDKILTMSTNAQWDTLFLTTNYTVANYAVYIHNKKSGNYNEINGSSSPLGLQSSILNMGGKVSGSGIHGVYAKLFYERVIVQLNLINSYGPNSTPMAPVATENTQKQEQGVLERMGQDPNSQVSKPTTGNISGITNIFPPTVKPDPIKIYLQ